MNRRRMRKVRDYRRTWNRLMTEAIEHAYAELLASMFGQGQPVFPEPTYVSHTVGPDFSAPPQASIEVFGDEIRWNTRMRVEYGHSFQVIRFDVDEEKENS